MSLFSNIIVAKPIKSNTPEINIKLKLKAHFFVWPDFAIIDSSCANIFNSLLTFHLLVRNEYHTQKDAATGLSNPLHILFRK
jgi:hypothetical protein